MAYYSDFIATSNSSAGAATVVPTLPSHVADDYIVICYSGNSATTLSASWSGTVSGSGQAGATLGGTMASAVFYTKATGTSATCSISVGTPDDYHIHSIILKDVNPVNPLNVVTQSAHAAPGGNDFSFNLPSVTTTTSSCLLLYYVGLDQATTTPTSLLSHPGGFHFVDSSDNGGTTVATLMSGMFGWYYQVDTGSTPTPKLELSNTEVTTRYVMAWRNKNGGWVPPYIDDYEPIGTKLTFGSWWVSATTRNNENFKATPLTYNNVGPNGAGIATSFDAAAAVADAGLNPYSYALNSTPPASTTNAIGFEVGFPTTTINMSEGWICGAFMCSTARMANFTQGTIKLGGTYLVIGQGANFRTFNIMGKDNQDGNGTGFSVFSVQANQTQSMSGYSATPPTITAIDKILILNRGQNGTAAYYYCDIHLFKKIIAAGGTLKDPVDTQGLADIAKHCRLPVIKKSGAASLLSYVPIQIGGGDPINLTIEFGNLQFPRIYNVARKEINYHGKNGSIGISYAGKSGDTIKHINSSITSPSTYYWEIHPSASSAATWDFSGLTIVGANVKTRPVMVFDRMTFSGCATLDFSDSTITNATISGVPTQSNSLTTTTNTRIATSSIDVSGVKTGSFWCSVTTSSIFNTCNFLGSPSSGHAINLTTTGTHSFSGLTFNGFGANNTSASAILNSSGGGVYIMVSNGGTTPTYRNVGAAATTVSNPVTFTIEIRDQGGNFVTSSCEVTVVKDSDTSILYTQENVVSGTSQYLYNYTTDTLIYINVLNVALYEPKTVSGITLTNTNQTVSIQLDDERGKYST